MLLAGQCDLAHTPGVRQEIDSRRRLVAEVADRRISLGLVRTPSIESVTAVAAEPRGLLDLLSTLGTRLHRANLMRSSPSTSPRLADPGTTRTSTSNIGTGESQRIDSSRT